MEEIMSNVFWVILRFLPRVAVINILFKKKHCTCEDCTEIDNVFL